MERIRIDFNEDGSIRATKSAVARSVTLMKKEGELPMDKNELITTLHIHLYFVDNSTNETKESVKDMEMFLLKNPFEKNKIYLANIIRSVKFQLKDNRFQGKSPEFVMGKTVKEGLPLLIKYVATESAIKSI